MRARTLGAFVLGFASGAALLTVLLWQAGFFTPQTVMAGAMQPIPCGPSHSISTPVVVTPPAEAPASPAPERTAPFHIAMPIAGVDPHSLGDTFNDARSGHRHEALDILAPRGTPVLAVVEGNVVKLFNSKDGGLTVYQFDNKGEYCYYYAHLDRYAKGLQEGTLLRKGDVLGYVGTTGNAPKDTPHLHFAVNKLNADKKWWEGTPINPLPLLQ